MGDWVYRTIGQVLDETVERYGERDALVHVERGVRYTYRKFKEEVEKAAKGLIRLGVKKGDHVALFATNVPEWVVTQFALAKIGAVLVTVNTSYRTHELEYVLSQSDATTLLLIDGYRGISYLEMVYEIMPELMEALPGQVTAKRLPFMKNVIYIGEEAKPGMYNWSDLIRMGAEVPQEVLKEREASLQYDEVINMQYTSGTTGFPKGVMLTHLNILNNAILVAERMGLVHQDRLMIPVPFFHTFGCVMSTLASVATGACMVPVTAFDAALVLRTVEEEGCTMIQGVPTMFIAELNHPDFGRYDLSTLRGGIMAGSNCPIEVMKRVMNEMGVREITIAYGLTESSPVITQTRTDDPIERRVSTVGKKFERVEVKIIDPVTGEELPSGREGELCTRSPMVMKGYYKKPEETAKAIDEEGWLHSGDLAVVDEEGYYRITGRIKDLIIRGGENISPREIEEFLYTHPKVMDVQVIGVPDEKYGEQVAAFIIPKQGMETTTEEIRQYCEGRIAHYKIPKYVFITDQYPMTASGKIQKYRLREEAKERIGVSPFN